MTQLSTLLIVEPTQCVGSIVCQLIENFVVSKIACIKLGHFFFDQ